MNKFDNANFLGHDEIKIQSLDHFLNEISFHTKCEEDKILYRGQKEDWNLYPKLVRLVIKNNRGNEYYEIEEKLLCEYKNRVSKFDHKITEYNDIGLWAIAQHYKLPTRFLDWSENPLVALWFALAEEKKNGNVRIVWSLVLNDSTYREEENIETIDHRFIKAYKPPPLLDPRISAQSAWFTLQNIDFILPNYPYDPHILPCPSEMIPLNEHNNFRYLLRRYLIPNKLRTTILQELDSLGINRSFLFPKLTKICKEIEIEIFKKTI